MTASVKRREAGGREDIRVRGIKAATVGTTLYLLPAEHKRLKRLALDLDLSVHDLVLAGIDRFLEESGLPRIKRYRPDRRSSTSTAK